MKKGSPDFRLDRLYHLFCNPPLFIYSCVVTPYSIRSSLKTSRLVCPLSLERVFSQVWSLVTPPTGVHTSSTPISFKHLRYVLSPVSKFGIVFTDPLERDFTWLQNSLPSLLRWSRTCCPFVLSLGGRSVWGLGSKVVESRLAGAKSKRPYDYKVYLSITLRWEVNSDLDFPWRGYLYASGTTQKFSDRSPRGYR